MILSPSFVCLIMAHYIFTLLVLSCGIVMLFVRLSIVCVSECSLSCSVLGW